MNFFWNRKTQFLKRSFSQSGEDLIVKYIFDCLKMAMPSYWDFGAYHPFSINNTAIFYEQGCCGINVEPNPAQHALFNQLRKRDSNVQAGVASVPGKGTYYRFDIPALNTFSGEEAEKYVKEGHRFVDKLPIDLLTPAEISERFFDSKWPDFLSLDVEGLDLDILKSLNFDNGGLIVICVESITYSRTGEGVKVEPIIDFLESKGYLKYADTYINSIFVRKSFWDTVGS
jgi:hypothetical protein